MAKKKKISLKTKIKKIAKYVLNILGAISMLVVGLNSIDGITIPYATQIVSAIAVINGVISTYLLSSKVKKEM